MTRPSIRKPLGVVLILAIITVWSIIVVAASPWIGTLHPGFQAIVYLAAGTLWIVPLGPVLRWMERSAAR